MWKLVQIELFKIFLKPRTYIAFAAIAAIVALIQLGFYVDGETYIKFGSPTSKAKSLGFENPVEHHFSYIDSDIQDPRHVVNDRPQLSRLSNKQSINYKGRTIY